MRRRQPQAGPLVIDPRLLDAHVEDWVTPSEATSLDEARQLATDRWQAARDDIAETPGTDELPLTRDREGALAMRDGGPEIEPTSVVPVKIAALAGTAVLRANPWTVGDRMPFRDEDTFAAQHWSAHR